MSITLTPLEETITINNAVDSIDVSLIEKTIQLSVTQESISFEINSNDVRTSDLVATNTPSAGQVAIANADGTFTWTTIAGATVEFTQSFDTSFYFDGSNQITNSNIYSIEAPADGYVIGVSVNMNVDRTAGSLTVKPGKNDTALVATNIDVIINATNTDNHNIEYDASDANFFYSQGDTINIFVTSSAYTPLNSSGDVRITFKHS